MGVVIRTKPITTVTAGMGTVHAVIPWEWESKIFLQKNINSNE